LIGREARVPAYFLVPGPRLPRTMRMTRPALTRPEDFSRAALAPPLYGEGLNTRRAQGGTPEASAHRRSSAKGWSIYGAQRAQPVATGGKWNTPKNRSNKPIRNRWQPTATVPERMVRRGSTVRVRQRLCKSPAKRRFFVRVHLRGPQRAMVWSPFWSLQIEKCLRQERKTATSWVR